VIENSTTIRWVKRWRETDSFEINRSQRRLLDERQQKAGIGSVWRFFDRHGVSFKKSVRAAEQDRSGVAAARTAWADSRQLRPAMVVVGCCAAIFSLSGLSVECSPECEHADKSR
jgi:hypothetical protein